MNITTIVTTHVTNATGHVPVAVATEALATSVTQPVRHATTPTVAQAALMSVPHVTAAPTTTSAKATQACVLVSPLTTDQLTPVR